MKKSILGLIAIGATILTANADIIPTLNPGAPVATSGGFIWNYSANVTVDQKIQTGDFFTIYDVANTPGGGFTQLLAGSNLQPAGWTFSSSLVGPTPDLVNPLDNANFVNLTWTYTGATTINGAAALGNFSVVINEDSVTTGFFAAQGSRNGGPDDGSHVNNVGFVSTPFGGTDVPEMSALLPIISVCGAGFVAGIPTFLRRRKNS